MVKGTKSSEFEKSEITALKDISKAIGRSKAVVHNYLKSPNKYRTRKPTGSVERLSPQF